MKLDTKQFKEMMTTERGKFFMLGAGLGFCIGLIFKYLIIPLCLAVVAYLVYKYKQEYSDGYKQKA